MLQKQRQGLVKLREKGCYHDHKHTVDGSEIPNNHRLDVRKETMFVKMTSNLPQISGLKNRKTTFKTT